MFIFGVGLFSGVLRIVENFFPFIIIVLVISLIERYKNGKKTNYGYVKPGETLMADVEDEKPENSSAMNLLLYIGSFLIVGSMFLVIRDEPRLMPITVIIVTLLSYIIGSILYRFVSFLRPVGIAFAYTAIILFPTWFYAFKEFGLSEEISMMLASLFSTLAYAGAAVIIESRVAGWLSYIFFTLFGWAFAASLDTASGSTNLLGYAIFIWPCLISVLANIFWSLRVKWLPVPFRKATKAIAEYVTPIIMTFAVLSVFALGMTKCPMIRTITASIAIINGLISWFTSKKRGAIIALRFYIQALIIFIIADATHFSVIDAFNSSNDAVSLSMAIVWMIGFLFQIICSLFVPQRNDAEKSFEKAVLVTSLAGIFLTTLFCLNFDTIPRAISIVVVSGIVALIGILIAICRQNVSWLIATVLALNFIPLGISQLIPVDFFDWVFFIIYTALALVLIIVYAIMRIMQANRDNSFSFAIAAIVTSGIACFEITSVLGHVEAGLLATAVELALVAIISKKYILFEIAGYAAACSASALLSNTTKAYYSKNADLALGIASAQANIIALPLLAFGFGKEYKSKNKVRTVFGYIILSFVMFIISSIASFEHNYVWPIVFIIEEIALLTVGIFLRYQWMSIASSILVIITTLELTGGFDSSIWLLLIGVGMIAFVSWQLVRANKKQPPTQQQ